MGFTDFLRRGVGLDLVSGNEMNDGKQSGAKQNLKLKKPVSNLNVGNQDKVLKQLEVEVSKSIEKLEDLRDKLRVRRGY